MPKLAGIIHAAGVLDDGVLLRQTWSRFASVLAPKAAGAWNLHEATRGLELDFFVLFSSIASLVGSPGQSNYAAANAVLDAIAHQRRALGLPALSINWGPWADAGMGARNAGTYERRWSFAGIDPLTPKAGLAAFERLLGTRETQVAVLSADWNPCLRSFGAGAQPRVFSELASPAPLETTATGESSTSPLAGLLSAATATEAPLEIVRAHVTAEVIAVMGLDPSTRVDPSRGLQEFGLDSLMALDLRDRLQQSAGVPLPSTLAFDFPTIDALASHLLNRVVGSAGAPLPAAAGPGGREDVLLKIEELSDEQVEKLLAQRMAVDGV
jgi:acyl carrier protein